MLFVHFMSFDAYPPPANSDEDTEACLIASRAAYFHALAQTYKGTRVVLGSPRPIRIILDHISAFVMEKIDTFIPRILSLGFAVEGPRMIILWQPLCNVLTLIKKSIVNELTLAGWVLTNISEEAINSPDVFGGKLPFPRAALPPGAVASAELIGHPVTPPNPGLGIEVPLPAPDDADIEEGPISGSPLSPEPMDAAAQQGGNMEGGDMERDFLDREFRHPDEALDVIEEVLDQVLNDPPAVEPVRQPPVVVKRKPPELTPVDRLRLLHAKFMRLSKRVKKLEKDLAERDSELAERDLEIGRLRAVVESLPIPPSSPPPATDGTIAQHILHELNVQINRNPKQRRFSPELVKFASALHAISAQAYRLLREVLPFPSAPRLQDLMRPVKTMIMTALDEQTGS
jgi:hypothetical protein